MDPRLKVVNHVLVLFREAFDIVDQIRNAPESPVTSYLPAKLRRVFRRNANRLRAGKVSSRYGNIVSAGDLITIFENTAARDETIERGFRKLEAILAEVERIRQYHEAELEEGMRLVYQVAWMRAEEDGPESKAADFFRLFQEMIARGSEIRTLRRRDKELPLQVEPFRPPGADPVRELHESIIAAEVVAAPEPGERMLRFPPDRTDIGEPPVILRIGIAEKCWVGSFRRGTTDYTTVQLMPDGAHILVVACGAAYIVEAVTLSPAAEAGSDVTDVIIDVEGGLLLLEHAGAYLEAFGKGGALWMSGRIGAGLREWEFGDGVLLGETRQGSDGDWVDFSVDLRTGEVAWSTSADCSRRTGS
jgi:Asp-tRNA(Asn)/Glu-tRNA(Gln) amidotransferase C subunit